MANFNQAFREEVNRIAKRASRSEVSQLKKASAQYRRDIAELKRQVSDLSRRLSFLEKQETRRVAKPKVQAGEKQLRFSPSWLKKHRAKIGFSAEDYGKLVGVSGQTIYMWEQEKTKPRRAQLEKLTAVRGIGKRDAERRLELLEKNQAAAA